MGARTHELRDLLGVRSSKGRYYSEYRHSSQDLQRALMAVNAVSWLLADPSGDARAQVDATLPVIADLLRAKAVVLVSTHPGLGGSRVSVRAAHPLADGPLDEVLAEHLVRRAEHLVPGSPPTGVLELLPDHACVLLLAPLPHSGRGDGYVVAAVPQTSAPDGNDLAILGTLTNQLAGAIESSRRLAASEASREAADRALRAADEQAAALARRDELLKQIRHELVGAREQQVLAEERQRIARDLHDSVAQHVLSMGMQVEWCRTTSQEPAVVERLTEVKALARSTVDRIRAAIFELSSGDEVASSGSVPALQRLADQHRGHGLVIDVRVRGRALRRLPAPLERVLHAVAKEALFNTVVHAEATSACVDLVHAGEEVRLQVSDDGLGCAGQLRASLEQARRSGNAGYHRGLANTEDRVRQVGGTLTILDGPERGVRLLVRLPTGEPR